MLNHGRGLQRAPFLPSQRRSRRRPQAPDASGCVSPHALPARGHSDGPKPAGRARSVGGRMEITESQNGQGWKGPLWVTQSNALPKLGHPEPAAQHRVQAGLEYLQRRRLHNLPGQPVPGLRHPQSEEVLPHVQTELPLLQFVPRKPPASSRACR